MPRELSVPALLALPGGAFSAIVQFRVFFSELFLSPLRFAVRYFGGTLTVAVSHGSNAEASAVELGPPQQTQVLDQSKKLSQPHSVSSRATVTLTNTPAPVIRSLCRLYLHHAIRNPAVQRRVITSDIYRLLATATTIKTDV
jgi:hypothetical protein